MIFSLPANNPVCTGSTSDGRFARSIPEGSIQTAKCYFIGEKEKSWTAARSDCFARGGDLATLMTSQEYVAMARMLDTVTWSQQGLYMWVGVNKKSFTWTSGRWRHCTWSWDPLDADFTELIILLYSLV